MAALSSSSGLLNRNAAALSAGIPCKYGGRAPQQEIQQSRRLCSQILRQNRSATHLQRLFIFNAAADGSAATTTTTTTTASSTGSGTNASAAESESEEATTSASDNIEEEKTEKPDEFYEVEITKPYGLKFYKGADGGTYIDAIAREGSAATTSMEPGDKVLATSAVFGDEIWPAAEYGRTMYTIRQRVGPLIMKMQKRYGVKEGEAPTQDELSRQRNATTITERLREMQRKNYLRKVELEKQRKEYLTEGLKLYSKGAYEDALGKFESILGMNPEPAERGVSCYNLACCYSQLNQIDAGLEALEEALEAGFDDYKHVRTDKDIANLRESERFKEVIDKYDEPILSETAIAAINAVKSLFGFGKN